MVCIKVVLSTLNAMQTLVTRSTFAGVIKCILSEVDLSHAVAGRVIEVIQSFVLDNFEAFSSFYRQTTTVDHSTNAMSRVMIGNAIRILLNERWPTENFQFETADITVNEYSGAFNSVFEGSYHIVRIHAYVGIGKDGLYPSQYTVDVYAVKTQIPSSKVFWGCCF